MMTAWGFWPKCRATWRSEEERGDTSSRRNCALPACGFGGWGLVVGVCMGVGLVGWVCMGFGFGVGLIESGVGAGFCGVSAE